MTNSGVAKSGGDGKSATNAGSVTAAFAIIGNEILSGRTQDKNLNHLACHLTGLGINLKEVRVVPDVPAKIISTVNELRAEYDYVFTSGGIGPTHDDITTECVAQAFGVPVVRDPVGYALLEAHYADDPSQLNEARAKMADVPKGASLIDNPVSKAPGYRVENVMVMAGVPRIFRAMVDSVTPELKGGAKTLSVSVSGDLKEGDAAKGLGELQDLHPDCDLGSYPYFRNGIFGTSLVARGTDPAELAEIEVALKDLVRALGANLFPERPGDSSAEDGIEVENGYA